MRYAICHDQGRDQWFVIDTAIADQVVGVHATRGAAVRHAMKEEEWWRGYDPVATGHNEAIA